MCVDINTGEYKDDFNYRCVHRKKIDADNLCDFKSSLNQNEISTQVETIISDMVKDTQFREYMIAKMDGRVDVSSLETEREQIRGQLRKVIGVKKKLTEMLDGLDVNELSVFGIL